MGLSQMVGQGFWVSLRALFRQRTTSVGTLVSREAIEAIVGMRVHHLELYEQALKHRSLLRGQTNSHLASNERLEFLGDAVLGFVTAEYLYHRFPEQDEGFLTRLRAKIVNGHALARYAKRLNLGPLILMSNNMAQSDGRRNRSILADALEALIGALYLDLGHGAAHTFIQQRILEQINLDELAHKKDNFKSHLLEFAQAQSWSQPQYRVTEEEGPSHDKRFTVEVLINGQPYGRGRAGSKKKAEQEAASHALDFLHDVDLDDL